MKNNKVLKIGLIALIWVGCIVASVISKDDKYMYYACLGTVLALFL